MRLLLKGGRIVDRSQRLDKFADLLIENGKIARICDPDDFRDVESLDLSGKVVLPGLIDMHVHFREPGFEHKEDIESGSKAAVIGGFTAVAPMPNTDPVVDCRSVVEFIVRRAAKVNLAKIYPIGALTVGLCGEQMAEIGDMISGGAVAFSDDGSPIADSSLMRHVMEYCAMFDVPVIVHCEDRTLTSDGLMNEGVTSTILGLKGIPRQAEDIAVARNIMLAQLTGCRLHIAHVSTAGAVDIIRRAKNAGVPVTCETCPHYFALTDEAVHGYNTAAKVNPPLRTAEDVEAIKQGLADGTIDVIATDHAPHAIEEKEQEFALAPSGMVGLETAVGLVITYLVKPGVISLPTAFEKLTAAPARILGIPGGTLEIGAPADITVLDPEVEWTVDSSRFYSKSKNTPFEGFHLTGAPVMTIVDGVVVAREGKVVA